MTSITIRSCPNCRCFTLQRDYMAETQLYVCLTCNYAVNEWNLNTGSAYTPPARYTAPKKPKPTSFSRTKTKKPTRKQLDELSAAIDNQVEA